MKSSVTMIAYRVLLLLWALPCSAQYELEKRFIDDTEIYQYVNKEKETAFQTSLTLMLDTSGSMGEFTQSSVPFQGWNPNKLYQSNNKQDACPFCDHTQYTSGFFNVYMDHPKYLRVAQGLHLLSPLFKRCSQIETVCEEANNANVLALAAWKIIYPELIYDGEFTFHSLPLEGICEVEIYLRERVYNEDDRAYENKDSTFTIMIPSISRHDCNNKVFRQGVLEKHVRFNQKYKNKNWSFENNDLGIKLGPFREGFEIKSSRFVDDNQFQCSQYETPKTIIRHLDNIKLINKEDFSNDYNTHEEKINTAKHKVKTATQKIDYLNNRLLEIQKNIDLHKSYKHSAEDNLRACIDYACRKTYHERVRKYDKNIKKYMAEMGKSKRDLAIQNNELLKIAETLKKLETEKSSIEKTTALSRLYDFDQYNVNKNDFYCAYKKLKQKGWLSISNFNYRNYLLSHDPIKSESSVLGTRHQIMMLALKYALENFLTNNIRIRFITFSDIDNRLKKPLVYKNYPFPQGSQSTDTIKQLLKDIENSGLGGETPTPAILLGGYRMALENRVPSSECVKANKAILFTDGDANQINEDVANEISRLAEGINNTAYSDKKKTCATEGIKDSARIHACSELLAGIMGNHNHVAPNGLSGKLPIYAIGFKGGMSTVGEKALHALSQANRGEDAILVETLEDMQQAFSEAVSFADLTEDSTVSPASPPTAGGGVSRGETAFFGLFKPDSKPLWGGNIKCYRVDLDADDHHYRYKDSHNQAAFCQKEKKPKDCVQPGQINPASIDYFNLDGVPDGDQVFKGGIRSRLQTQIQTANAYKQRSLSAYTDKSKVEQEQLVPLDLSHNNTAIPESVKQRLNSSFQQASYRVAMPSFMTLTDDLLKRANNWLAGFNEAGTELRTDIGDLLHTEITVLNYQNDSLLIAPSNDGFLRAYKVESSFDINKTRKPDFGELVYSFIPKELFANVWWRISSSPLKNRKPYISKFYGFDGSVTPIHFDTNLNGIIDKKERAFVIVGMRRGGNSYYLFDVSNPFSNRNPSGVTANPEAETQLDAQKIPDTGILIDTAAQPPIAKPPFKEGIQLVRRMGGVETYLNHPLTQRRIEKLKKIPALTDRGELDIAEWNNEKNAYRVLAQTWSKPQLVKLALSKRWPRTLDNAEVEPPLGCDHAYCYAWIFGGGYHPNVRDMTLTKSGQRQAAAAYTDDQDDDIGNAIYMINAATGKLLWWASSEQETEPKQYIQHLESVPGAITTINVGGDNGNATDAGFFFDIEGGLYRINFHDFKAKIDYHPGSLDPKWKDLIAPKKAIVRLGKLSHPKINDRKRFTFYEPAVTFFTDSEGYDFFAIGFGTGYRPSPKRGHAAHPTNIIGVLFDYPVYEPKYQNTDFVLGCTKPKKNCLLYVNKDTYSTPRDKLQSLNHFKVNDTQKNRPHGWYIALDKKNREKVLSAGKTVNGYLAIESFLPQTVANPEQANACVADLGERRIWVVDLKNGKGYFDNDQRYQKSGRSLPVERLGLIRNQGDYLVTGTRLQDLGADAVNLGSGQQPKRELGWREGIPESAVFSNILETTETQPPTSKNP